MSDKIRVGILGCADIADRFVIPAFQSSSQFEVAGIASRCPNTANKFAKKFSILAYRNYEDLINSQSLDAVYIPLPNSLHFEWVRKSLDNNLHVLVEKSLACTFEDVLRLTNLAKSKRLVLLENFQFRFHSQLSYIKSLVLNGEIGDLRNIRSSFGFPPFKNTENIRYNKSLGGGALLDAGAYPLKIVQMFMGKNVYVSSSCLFVDKFYKVDTYGSFQINDPDLKIAAQGAFGFDNFYKCNLELWGSKGVIQANRIFTSPPGEVSNIDISSESGDRSISIPPDDHFKKMLEYFFYLLNNKDKLEIEYRQNLQQAKLLAEIWDKSE